MSEQEKKKGSGCSPTSFLSGVWNFYTEGDYEEELEDGEPSFRGASVFVKWVLSLYFVCDIANDVL